MANKAKRKNIAVSAATHERLKKAAGDTVKLQGFTDELINNALDIRERYQSRVVTL